jgi:hypothetical protein
MKLRIKGNSIRLRLLRSEVERFAAEGSISEAVHFGAQSLRYTLIASPSTETIRSRFDNGEIVIEIPADEASSWAESDHVSIAAEQPIGGENLSILVEKDFACLDRPNDPDREDAFPNPTEACKKGDNL